MVKDTVYIAWSARKRSAAIMFNSGRLTVVIEIYTDPITGEYAENVQSHFESNSRAEAESRLKALALTIGAHEIEEYEWSEESTHISASEAKITQPPQFWN